MPPDYSGQNLRGRNFKGQDLTGANFGYADIRSADFTDAILVGASFSYAIAGLQKRWVIFLLAISWLLSGLSGFSSAVSGLLVSYIFSNYLDYQIVGWITIITLIIFFVVTIRSGIQTGLETFTGTGAIAGAIIGAITVARVFAGAFAFAGATGIAFTFAVAISFAFAVAFAGAIAGAGSVAIGVAIAVIVVKIFAVVRTITVPGAIVVACTVAIALALFGVYIGWRAMKGDEKHALIRNIAVAFATYGSTSFRGADLTNADFTHAKLKNTDFTGATLTRTCWKKAKKLDLVRPGESYLKNALVYQLLVTGLGQNKIFDRQDLRGVNLRSAHLAGTSFIGADLSEANLQDADLSRAKLVQAQLNGTDFTGATLTGAIIEDWNITSHTKLHGVRCGYVFMRLVEKGDPDQNPRRKPDNWEEKFSDGEFDDFIKPIVDTLDLYHNSGVDPRAIAISFKQLAENHPEAELRIVGMEVKGNDKYLLRAKTAPQTNKSELSAEYFDTYNHIKSLPEQDIKLLLAEKDSRIHSLENMVETALQRPGFYAQTYHNQGDTMPEASKYDMRSSNFPGGFAETNYGNMVETQHNYAAQTNLREAAAEIQELLKQLDQSYKSDTTTGKMTIATEAIKRIESDPTIKERVLSALKAGGVEALAQLLNHPAASFVIGALEDWQKTKDS